MRSGIGSNTVSYLNARQGTVSRQLIWFAAKNRATGEIESVGFSNLEYNLDFQVKNGEGATITRTYYGAGSIIDISEINLVSDLTIQTVRMKLNQSNDVVNNAIRGYDMRNAACEVHYPLYDLSTRLLVDIPTPHFVGRVDKSELKRGKIGSPSGVYLEAHSRVRDLTLKNPSVKSHSFQQLRHAGDNFRKYGDNVGNWAVWWGEDKKPVVTNAQS